MIEKVRTRSIAFSRSANVVRVFRSVSPRVSTFEVSVMVKAVGEFLRSFQVFRTSDSEVMHDRRKTAERWKACQFTARHLGLEEGVPVLRRKGLHDGVAGRAIGTQDVRTVMVGRGGLQAAVEAAKAQLRLAQIDLDNTVIRAPVDGQLSEIGVRNGAFVSPGAQLLFLVPHDVWIVANFKEAQTRDMRIGQPVTFRVDALGNVKLRGHVESLAPAAGSEFAVIKSDNATGNFVKVAQRIAVRIAIEPRQQMPRHLQPGMSVEVAIDTRGGGR
eukprot:gene37459-50558_t